MRSGEVKGNNCSTKTDLLHGFSAPAGLKVLVQICFLEHDPLLVTECPLCQLLGITELAAPLRTRGACTKRSKFQKYQWVPMVFPGKTTQGYVAGQLE